MTRPARTEDENWAIGLLLNELRSSSAEWGEAPGAPSDKPDLVLAGPNKVRVACEITQVNRSEWFRWQNDRGLQLDVDKLDQAAVPREVDIWLEKAIAKKAPRVPDYITNSLADEVWLLVHGGVNKVFDFFNLDDTERYDIPLLVKSAEALNHPFQRVYVASSNSNRIVCVFPFDGERHEAPDIRNPSTLKVLSIRSIQIKTQPGVNRIPIGNEFKPDRNRLLPLLDPKRLKGV